MTSFQSTLGEGEGIAEELAASQREISIAEFFEKNKHMLGFDSEARALVTAVKEGVDNSIDAAEEAGILPDIYVEIREADDYYQVVIEDNGPGITKEQIPKVFGKLLYGSRFHKREQSLPGDQNLLIKRDGQVETIPIGTICDAYLPQEGEATREIPATIEVPSFSREGHEVTWQPVTHAIRHETDEQTLEITTEKGRTVEITANHSLFGLTDHGETKEINAGEVEPGDWIIAPQSLPSPGKDRTSVNILEYISADQLIDRNLYVYGFDRDDLEELRNGDVIRKYPNDDSSRKRYYYRYDGVDILRDSLEQNYLEKGYLPAETVKSLGWEERASDGELRTYKVGGKQTTIPVTIEIDNSFVELLAYYISEGHVGPRQVGFTFGSHESELIQSTEIAIQQITGSSTTVSKERNSTRVKAFGSPLSMFLEATCGSSASGKRMPDFVFELEPALQQRFIAALYQGDGSDSHPKNELSHTTVSETLARQLSILWNMNGVLASTEVTEDTGGYADEGSTRYRTKVYGEDTNLSDVFEPKFEPGEQQYKRIPSSILDSVRVSPSPSETVPDTIPGLLMGAGVGSNLDHAKRYQEIIERALAGDHVDVPRYVYNLKEYGLLDSEHTPTAHLRELWDAIHSLQNFTDSDMCFLKIKSVRETSPPEYVYDISVPGATGYDENFVVANEGAISVKNSRGQQGIGISAAVLYSQLTSGKPAKITSRTQGDAEAQYFELVIDTDSNEPEIRKESGTSWDRAHGTRIELEMEGNMRARSQLHDYIKHTAVVNPHARIELREPDAHIKSERAEGAELPAETEEIRPHPHGVELGTLLKMLQATDSHSARGFLQEEFTRVGRKTADQILDEFRDRQFGREFRWKPPQDHEDVDLRRSVVEAISNKGADLERKFADQLAKRVEDESPVSYSELEAIVDRVADDLAESSGTTFGSTVRENVVEAAWEALTFDRTGSIYAVIDDATTSRKDDKTKNGLAERLVSRIDGTPRDRFTKKALKAAVDNASDLTEEMDEVSIGETARENIVEQLWGTMDRVEESIPKTKELAEDRDSAGNLLDGMNAVSVMAPPTSCLSPITAEQIEAGLRKEFDAEFFAASSRDAEVHSGDPFIVEAGIAYGGSLEEEGQAQLMRFANRVPLVYQRGACATTDVVKRIGWRNYGLEQPGGRGIPNGPVVIMIHVASTNVPFTSESKDALANIPSIEDEIELAVREAARELKSYLNKRRSMEKRRQKQNVIADILPKMAAKVSEMTDREPVDVGDSLARIMNNVLVEREVENGTVKLFVENHDSQQAQLEITDIVSVEPTDLTDGEVIEMDGEWFVKWKPTVGSGDDATLEYSVDGDADFDLDVKGVEEAKLTVDQ